MKPKSTTAPLGRIARALAALFSTVAALSPAPLHAIASGLGPDGIFYEVVLHTDGTTLTWEQARDAALGAGDSGSRLAEIDSEEVDLLIEKLRQQALADAGIDPASPAAPPLWIGGRQQPGQPRPDDGWVWDNDGRALPGNAVQGGYSNWLKAEPNDWPSAIEDGQETYAAIGFGGQFGWNDRSDPCTGYVRQYDIAAITFDTGPRPAVGAGAYHFIQGTLCLDFDEAVYDARRRTYDNGIYGLRVGELAKVASDEEFAALDAMMDARVLDGWESNPAIGPFWLGATQSPAAGTPGSDWSWLDGAALGAAGYERWLAGQPDDAPGGGVEDGEENALVMETGRWADVDADEERFATLIEYRELPPHSLVERSTRYDGASAIRYPYLPGYTRHVAMCLEAWIYRSEGGPIFQTLFAQGFANSIWFGLADNELRFYRSGGSSADSTATVPLGQWTHVAVSYDGSFARFYINGESAGERALANAGTGTADDIYLGRDPGAVPYFLHGQLDEVRIWSTARSRAQIRADMHRELEGAPGLEGVWPRGGLDVVPGGFASDGRLRIDRFGMLPRALVVPAANTPPVFDGDVNLDTEYSGAEQIALRYGDGPNAKDAVGYLVHTKDYLYLGIEGARLPAAGAPSVDNALSAYIDSDASTDGFDADLLQGRVFLQDGASGSSRVKTVSVGAISTQAWSSTPTPAPHQFQGRMGEQVRDELGSAPDLEFRFHRELIGNPDYTAVDRLALAHTDNGGASGDRWSPEGAADDAPASWVEMRYYPAPDPGLPRLSASGVVTNPSNGDGVPGVAVSVVASTLLASTTSDAAGRWSLADVALPEGVAYRISITPPPSARTDIAAEPDPAPRWTQPVSVGTTHAVMPPVYRGRCHAAPLTFYVLEPIASTVLGNFDPGETWPPVLVRGGAAARRVSPGIVRVDGFDLHDALDFHFARPGCPNDLSTCTPGVDYFPADGSPAVSTFVPATAADAAHVLVEVPDIPRSRWGFMRLTAHDTWSRPGNVPSSAGSWKNFGSPIAIVEPPYELIHGFHFENIADDHDFDDYRAAFFDQICNPFYAVGAWAFFPIYYDILGGGECLGMAVTAQQFARGRLATTPLDLEAIYGNGFLTLRQFDGSEHPATPATFDVANLCSPAPTNVWAQIKANQGAQLSSEFIGATLEQFTFAAGPDRINLRDQIEKIRGQETRWILCLRNGDKGHCVQPLRIVDIDANTKQIEIWDNNFPERTRTIDIDLSGPHRYTYNGLSNPAVIDEDTGAVLAPATPWSGNWIFVYEVDPLYDAARHVPSIDTAGYALGRFGVTHLWDLLQLIVSGDAEPSITAGDGSTAGWDAAGDYGETGDGIAAIPNFNWIPGEAPDLGHHPMSFHVRTDGGAPLTRIHNRGESYKIHASHHGTMFQFFVSDGIPDATDAFTYSIATVPDGAGGTTERVDGACFEAGAGGREVEARVVLCQDATRYPGAVTMEKVRVAQGGQAMVVAHLDGTGFSFTNHTGADVEPSFNIVTPGPAGALPQVRDTPELFIPAKAVLTVESPDGSDFENLLFLLDEDGDGADDKLRQYRAGTGEFVAYIPPAEPYLRLGDDGDPGTVTLIHPLAPQGWELQASESLAEGDWSPLDLQGATVKVVGDELWVTAPILDGRWFFRYAESGRE